MQNRFTVSNCRASNQ